MPHLKTVENWYEFAKKRYIDMKICAYTGLCINIYIYIYMYPTYMYICI